MDILIREKNRSVANKFKWRDRRGKWHAIKKMKTRHLFYTLRMIWNHSAPKHLRLEPYRKYNFNLEIYTPEYMSLAVIAIYRELRTRTDLTDQWIADLDFMESCFRCTPTQSTLEFLSLKLSSTQK